MPSPPAHRMTRLSKWQSRLVRPPAPVLYLALAVALSAIPLIVIGRVELLRYDGFWHVFIARQEQWRNLWEEIRENAHPPLYYLSLKAAIWIFGRNLLAYRLVSIVATLATTWLVGRIVQRTTRHPVLPAVAAFAFGSSLATVTIALEVRAYALACMFMVWACLALLDLVEDSSRRRARAVFTLAASLAALTHYAAFVFLFACWVVPVFLTIVDRDYRERLIREDRRRALGDLIALAIPTMVLMTTYAVHLGLRTRHVRHIGPFVYRAHREGILEFVWRGTRNLFELFVPPFHYRPFASTQFVSGPQLSAAAVGILAILVLTAAAWLACGPLAPPGNTSARRVPPILFLAMTAGLIAVALLGRYPYGGPLRHQYYLFPFGVIVLSLLVHEAVLRPSRGLGALTVGVFAVATIVSTANWQIQFHITRGLLLQSKMDTFRDLFPDAKTVYVDQYNFITFFMHHHERQWRFVGQFPGHVDVWQVSETGLPELYVCRDRGQWLLDLSRPVTYRRMRRCLDATGSQRLTVLRTQQRKIKTAWPTKQTKVLATKAAEGPGLVPARVVVKGKDVYAVFARP